MKFIVSLLLWITFMSSLFSQVQLTGTVIDADTKEQIKYATITLLEEDSTFVNGTISDTLGVFTFTNIPSGNYILSTTFVGYEKKYLSVNNLDEDINIGNLYLKESALSLQEVTVTAQSVIQKIDRKIIMPSAAQIRVSDNGVTLLQNLQLSRIVVNPMDNTISIPGGGAVQLRINGVLVSMEEIVALQPANVIRVEYHDDPGMRYGGAGAVIDYIVRRRETGGGISANLANSVSKKTDWGENYLSGKLNNKKSEFSIGGYWSRRGLDWIRENEETFVFPDKVLTRSEIGAPTKRKDQRLNLSLNYNLNEPDSYVLNIRLRNNYQHIPNSRNDRNSIIYSSDGTPPINVSSHSTSRTNIPSVDVYYQQNLNKKELLIFNLVGTYMNSRFTQEYTEQESDNLMYIYSSVHGDRYSLIGEGIYENTFQSGKLSTGIKHTQSYTRNDYSGNYSNNRSNMQTAETHMYVEYLRKVNKVSYTLGLGVSRTYNHQGNSNSEKYIFRPSVRITYSINDYLYIRYNGYISGNLPSLADMNDIELRLDSFQVRRGNPELKAFTSYINTLNVGYNRGIFSAEFLTRFNYDHKPTMEQVTYEKDNSGDYKFFRTIVNQKGFYKSYSSLYLKMKPWKDYMSVSLTPEYEYYINDGNNFRHTYSYWRVRGSIYGMYKGWALGFEGYTRWNNMIGEIKLLGEKFHTLNARYTTPKWSLGMRMFNPFSTHYDQTTQNYSALLPSTSHVYTNKLARTVIATLSVNMNFGRQTKAGNKILDNVDNETGIMSSGKD